MSRQPEMAKVLFRVMKTDGSANVETLWAVPLGGDLYRLDNSPFYAYGVSWNDVVSAPLNPDEGMPTFDQVVTKSGHKTIRIIFQEPAAPGNETQTNLDLLVALGCSYEGANGTYISIDIPPDVELDRIRKFAIELTLNFEHADPTFEELFPVNGF